MGSFSTEILRHPQKHATTTEESARTRGEIYSGKIRIVIYVITLCLHCFRSGIFVQPIGIDIFFFISL